MYGTNDMELGRPQQYAELMLRLTRMLTVRGVIPIMSTIMPRDDDSEADRMVSLYNAIVRGIAQGKRLPMVDFHRELARLPDHGLASSDHLHPNVLFENGDPRGCVFTEEGLRHGYDVRNLITIEALDRLRRVVLDGQEPPDEPAPPLRGAGSVESPIRIASLPFAHMADTHDGEETIHAYPGCESEQDESGPELVYRVHLDEPATVHAMVVDEGTVDVDLHHVALDANGPRCLERSDEALDLTLEAGDHAFVVDTFVDGQERAHAGRYLFVLARTDRPSDPDDTSADGRPGHARR